MANSIVSQAGMEEIEVLVHGAANLFKPGSERLSPRAFVSFKSESDFDNNVPARSSTTVARKSSAPIWAEVVQLKFKASEEITAILSVIDYDSKAVLSKFKIPSQRLQPFQQYHLELVDKDTSCFVSIRRKQHMCPEKSLEFVLCEMSDEINDNDLDGFTAIFRPVSDILHYREAYMQLIFEGQNRSVIDFQPIDLFSESPRSPCDSPVGFPQAIPMSFRVAKASLSRHSWWHNVILTPRYCEGLFNPTSGCVVEIYRNSLLEENDSQLRYRKPFGYAEITMQSLEENILQRMEDGVCFTNILFRQIKLQGPVLPKLKVAFRLLQRESSFQLEPSTIGQLLSIDVVSLLNLRMGNSSGSRRKSRRDQVEDAPYPADSAVSDLLARAYEDQAQSGLPLQNRGDALSPSPSQLRRASLNETERQQRALIRMSADLLAERKHRENLEDQKYELEEQLNRVQRDLQLRHTLVHDGLEGAAPDEIAHRFMTMRDKYKQSVAENEKLKEKLRQVSDSISRGDGQKNKLLNELKRASDQSDKHLEELNRMSRRLKDQKKLEDLCREQERIISKLEELFAKTRVNVDSRWKDDVDRLMHATKTREKYTPGNFGPPQYSALPGLAPPASKLPGYHMQEEIETERMRTSMLERQINEMARDHAREKQDLVNRIEEIRNGYAPPRVSSRFPELGAGNGDTRKPFDQLADHYGHVRY